MVVTGTLPVFNLTQDGPGEKKVRFPTGEGLVMPGESWACPKQVWDGAGIGRLLNWTGAAA